MTERATDPQVAWYASNDPTAKWNKAWHLPADIVLLAREVQASRKLAADLLAVHHQGTLRVVGDGDAGCGGCGYPHPCPTVRLIEASKCTEVAP